MFKLDVVVCCHVDSMLMYGCMDMYGCMYMLIYIYMYMSFHSTTDPAANAQRGFINNSIRTSKYNILTFLPVNL